MISKQIDKRESWFIVGMVLAVLSFSGCGFNPPPQDTRPVPQSINFAPGFSNKPVTTALQDRVEPTTEHRTFVQSEYNSNGQGELYEGPFLSPTIYEEIPQDLLVDLAAMRLRRGPNLKQNFEGPGPPPKVSDYFASKEFSLSADLKAEATIDGFKFDNGGQNVATLSHPVVAQVEDIAIIGERIAVHYRGDKQLTAFSIDGNSTNILEAGKSLICLSNLNQPESFKFLVAESIQNIANCAWLAPHLIALAAPNQTLLVDVDKELVVARFDGRLVADSQQRALKSMDGDQIVFPKREDDVHQTLLATDRKIDLDDAKLYAVEVNIFNTPRARDQMKLIVQRLRRRGFPVGPGQRLVRVTAQLKLTDRLNWSKADQKPPITESSNKIYIPSVFYQWRTREDGSGSKLEKDSMARFQYGYSQYFQGSHRERGRARTSSGATYLFPHSPEICILEEVLDDKSQLVCPEDFVHTGGFASLLFDDKKISLPISL